MTEYFTVELVAILILPIIATVGFMHSKRKLVHRPAVMHMVRGLRR